MPAKSPVATSAKPPAATEKTSLDYLQMAVQDLDRARERAGEELRAVIDDAVRKLREAIEDLRRRAESQTAEWEKSLEHAADDVLLERGRRAAMASATRRL
jgi:uncharacterized protein YicC (UPF0701 family)